MSPLSPGWPPRSDFSWLRLKPSAGRSLSLLPAPSDDLHPTTIRISPCYIIFKRGKGWKSETPQNSKSADNGNLLLMFFFLFMLIISFFLFLLLTNPFSTTIAIRIGVTTLWIQQQCSHRSPDLKTKEKKKHSAMLFGFCKRKEG